MRPVNVLVNGQHVIQVMFDALRLLAPDLFHGFGNANAKQEVEARHRRTVDRTLGERAAKIALVRGVLFRRTTVSEFVEEHKPDAAEWGRRLATANFNLGTFLRRCLAEHVDLKGAGRLSGLERSVPK